ncbi:MAG: coproporphyrinogen III oxidase, partial [Acidobacteriota bacterium]|nr:coproporphyrinogen III oxidase [Acidobacteriota bacterium]
MKKPDVAAVLEYLTRLRDEVCKDLAAEDGKKTFIGSRDVGVRGGFTEPRMLEAGPVLERAAVHLTRSRIESWPSPSPERAARAAAAPYDAVSVSVIVHPRNPYAPAAHANLRFFVSSQAAREPVWWFGGGYDLTPTYGFEEDARHWHETARRACDPFGAKV